MVAVTDVSSRGSWLVVATAPVAGLVGVMPHATTNCINVSRAIRTALAVGHRLRNRVYLLAAEL